MDRCLAREYLAAPTPPSRTTARCCRTRFNNLPKYSAEVVREPSFSEVAGGAAHAAGPEPRRQRPGRVYVHLLGETEDPAAVTDLMCHEGIPGHVMAGDIQVRQNGHAQVPQGRRLCRLQ